MISWKKTVLAGCLGLMTVNTLGYDIVDRAKLIDDRFKTQEMLRPYGHDFYLNINGAVTADAMDLKDDADKIGDIDSGDVSNDLDQANQILEKYYDKEQVLRAKIDFGIPIFSFNAFGVNFEPNFRFGGGVLAILTPRKTQSSIETIIDNLDQIPADVRSQLKTCLNGLTAADDGKDLLVECVSNGAITQAQADYVKETYNVDKIPYESSIATTTTTTPSVDVYAKVEAKAGLWFDYTKGEHFFGTFGLYGLGRLDIKKSVDGVLLLGGGGNIDTAENTLINAAIDYRFGYKNSNYSAFAAVEELKLAEISSEDEGTPSFGNSALIRLHGQADYKLSFFKLSPFAGTHMRSGYNLGDGLYLGADWGMHTWEERIALTFRTQLDKEHFTLGAAAKLWLLQLDLQGKFAVKDSVDDIKVSNYYSANFRLFF
ncbi:hypothetical protein [Halobacteriovorax marinus]|uniref:hypothetical protein n=1 Tax=Halobacteriovorax marinus TaxID=97084 RepID=UPI003A91DFCB